MARTHIDSRRGWLLRHGLAYQKGRPTSLADIAREAGFLWATSMYYFKTKDEIGEAIVEQRLAPGCPRSGSNGAKLDAQGIGFAPASKPSSRTRIFLAQRGFAVGLLLELHKAGARSPPERPRSSLKHLAWIESQFRALGKGKIPTALPCTCFRLARRFRSGSCLS